MNVMSDDDRAPLALYPADLVFVHSSALLPELIEDVTGCKYYHVAGLARQNELIEAESFRKTGYRALDVYDGQADVFRCESLTSLQRQHIVQYAEEEIGTHYDYLLIVWEGIRYVLHILLPFYEGNRRICSTLWADAYRSAGVELCPGIAFPSAADLAVSERLRCIGSL